MKGHPLFLYPFLGLNLLKLGKNTTEYYQFCRRESAMSIVRYVNGMPVSSLTSTVIDSAWLSGIIMNADERGSVESNSSESEISRTDIDNSS